MSSDHKQKSSDNTTVTNTTIDTNTDPPKSEQEVSVQDSAMDSEIFTSKEDKKKEHTVHRFLHFPEMKCNLCETAEECSSKYDEEFASKFKQFLSVSLLSPVDQGVSIEGFFNYIEAHLKAKKCPSPCSRLWNYFLENKLLGNIWFGNEWLDFFQYAPEGLLIYSVQKDRQNLVGTVVDTYFRYTDANNVASGGFGNVYKFPSQMAVKEEFKRPLITNCDKLFYRVMELDHPNVISILEYIAAVVSPEEVT